MAIFPASRSRRRLFAVMVIFLLAGSLVFLWSPVILRQPQDLPRSFSGDSLVCAIAVDDQPLVRDGLVAGLNMELIRRCAREDRFVVRFVRPMPGDRISDSLRVGRYDLLVAQADSLQGFFSRVPAPGEGVVWALAPRHGSKADSLERWLTRYQMTPEYAEDIQRFNCLRTPRKALERGWQISRISPYDTLLRACARELQWDWRLLSALVFTESKFSSTAESRRGAFGLMQIVPENTEHRSHLLDPAQNLAYGTAHLRRMQRFFRSQGVEDRDELLHLVVAAYNAGEGRMIDCMTLAEQQGLDPSRWEDVRSVIPLMAEYADSIETVALGRFHGKETLAYVDSVFSIYSLYCTLLP